MVMSSATLSLFKADWARAAQCWIPVVLHMVSDSEPELMRGQMDQGT